MVYTRSSEGTPLLERFWLVRRNVRWWQVSHCVGRSLTQVIVKYTKYAYHASSLLPRLALLIFGF